MPITDSYDDTSAEIIRACDVITPCPGFPTVAIATFSPATLALMQAEYGLTPLTTTSAAIGTVQAWALDDGGQRFAVYASPMGAPFATAVLEQFIALGTSAFVFFGECGVFDGAIPAGHIIVPTRAYRDEGTSYHYAPAADWIDVATADETERVLSAAGAPYIAGPVWTTDAFFRETRAVMERRRQAGCIAVDMECSALAAAAALRGVAVHQILWAADSLDADTWDARVLGAMPAEPRLAHARIALEIARHVADTITS